MGTPRVIYSLMSHQPLNSSDASQEKKFSFSKHSSKTGLGRSSAKKSGAKNIEINFEGFSFSIKDFELLFPWSIMTSFGCARLHSTYI